MLPPPYAAGANVSIGTAFPEESFLIENPVPFCYDYSHLVGSSVNHQQSKRVDAARFEELLTDYDRILLGFGMRILIPSDDSPSQSME